MSTRRAHLGDLLALAALEAAAFPRDAWTEGALADELAAETRFAFVAEDGDEVTGYAIGMAVGDTADIQRIVVSAGRRREGIGQALLAELMVAAAERGCERLLLEVADDNEAAIALYLAHGFAEIHRRRDYYRGGLDALVLARVIAST